MLEAARVVNGIAVNQQANRKGRCRMNQTKRGDGTVGKALEVLDQIAAVGRPVRFTEMLEQSPHPKATLFRLFQTLTSQGMLTYDSERQTYALGMRLVRLAHAAWRQSSLAPLARPHIDELARQVGETVHLAQLDQGQVLYVDKRNAAQPIHMFSDAGKIGPGYCTGVGKAMIAFLDKAEQAHAIKQQAFHAYTPNTIVDVVQFERELQEIRSAGVAFDREEHEPQIICIAAPILSDSARMLGALSITTTTSRHTLSELQALKPQMLETARKIGQIVQSWQYPDQNKNQ